MEGAWRQNLRYAEQTLINGCSIVVVELRVVLWVPRSCDDGPGDDEPVLPPWLAEDILKGLPQMKAILHAVGTHFVSPLGPAEVELGGHEHLQRVGVAGPVGGGMGPFSRLNCVTAERGCRGRVWMVRAWQGPSYSH